MNELYDLCFGLFVTYTEGYRPWDDTIEIYDGVEKVSLDRNQMDDLCKWWLEKREEPREGDA